MSTPIEFAVPFEERNPAFTGPLGDPTVLSPVQPGDKLTISGKNATGTVFLLHSSPIFGNFLDLPGWDSGPVETTSSTFINTPPESAPRGVIFGFLVMRPDLSPPSRGDKISNIAILSGKIAWENINGAQVYFQCYTGDLN
jgi:hypothetical protein